MKKHGMIWQPEDLQVQKIKTRACLKKAFRELRVPVCGRFYPNEDNIYRKLGLTDCGNDFSDTL